MDFLLTDRSFLQAILVLSIICAAGIALGKVRFKGFSLGVSCVFFVGIIAGHFGFGIDPAMLSLAQNFGLVLFVYALGLQVGPGFFSSFKEGGLSANLMSMAVIVIGTLLSFAVVPLTGMDYPTVMGLFCGAVTNTPMLGAAQQTLLQADPSALAQGEQMAMGCAVGYPFGIIAMILAIVLLKAFFGHRKGPSHKHENPTFIAEYEVRNPAAIGKNIRQITEGLDLRLVISRLWRNGNVMIPNGDTVLAEGDRLMVLSDENVVSKVEMVFGVKSGKDWNSGSVDWNALDSSLVSRHILVTDSSVNGHTLSELHFRKDFNVIITRINRADIDILASPSLRLQTGDRLTVVGDPASIEEVAGKVGNSVRELETPNLLPIFVGIIIGLLLGCIPLYLPGMDLPVRVGIAAGPIVAGILMGAYGNRFHLMTYTTHSANLMLRQMGITVYLASLGLSAGPAFFETVFRTEGFMWIGISLLLALVPVLLVGVFVAITGKLSLAGNVGMLCGAMANPFALTFGLSLVGDDDASVSYATVYPAGMFLRVVIAQVAMLLML